MKATMTILGVLLICLTSPAFADDCDSIRSAIANLPPRGGDVAVAKGIYNCGAPIVIDRSNVTLKGAGQDQVTIRLIDHVHAPLLIVGDPATIRDSEGRYVVGHRVSNIRVSGLSFDGNRANHDPAKECGEGSCDGNPTSVRNNGITIRGASDVVISDIASHSMISGGMVTEKYCDHLLVHGFNSYDNFFDGFAGYETTDSEFYDLNLHDNQGAGISIDINFSNNVVRDSKLQRNSLGIFARNLSGDQFIRLKILDNRKLGVFLAEADSPATCARDNQFDAVEITGTGGFAFRMNNECAGNKITGASNLCGNKDGGLSESTPGTVFVSAEVKCK